MGDSTAFLECLDPGFELKCSNILNSQIPASNVLDYFKSLSHQTGASVLLGKVGWLCFLMRSPHKMLSYTRHIFIWGFPTRVVPQNGWFVMENPIKTDDFWAVPLFLETPISKPGSFFVCA